MILALKAPNIFKTPCCGRMLVLPTEGWDWRGAARCLKEFLKNVVGCGSTKWTLSSPSLPEEGCQVLDLLDCNANLSRVETPGRRQDFLRLHSSPVETLQCHATLKATKMLTLSIYGISVFRRFSKAPGNSKVQNEAACRTEKHCQEHLENGKWQW